MNYPPIPEVAPLKSPHVNVTSTTLERTYNTGNEKGRSKDGAWSEGVKFSPINYPPIPEVAPLKSPHVDVATTTLERRENTRTGKGRSKDGGSGRGNGRGKQGVNKRKSHKNF